MSDKIVKLMEEREQLICRMKEMQQEEERSENAMDGETLANYDKLMQDIDNMSKRIRNAEELEKREAMLDKPVNEMRSRVAISDKMENRDEKRDNFLRYLRQGIVYDRRAMQVGTDSEGGYLCPDEYIKELIDTTTTENVMRPLAHVITTSSGTAEIPIVSTNVTAYWKAEEAAYQDSDMAFSQGVLNAYKITALTKVSEELVHDSVFDLEGLVMKDQARQVAAAEEAAFIAGDGSGKPTGVINGGTSSVTTASATAITADELFDLVYALPQKFRKNAVFIMNDATVKLVRKLKDLNGQYIWQPALTGGQPDTLMGYKLYTSSSMPVVAQEAKTVAFGDMSQYWIADREGAVMQRLNELYAANGQIGFRLHKRVDGKLLVATAVQILKMHA